MSQDLECIRLPLFPVGVLSTVLSTKFLARQEAQYWPHHSCDYRQPYSDIEALCKAYLAAVQMQQLQHHIELM